jgi:Protein of unknown function (DUF3667)
MTPAAAPSAVPAAPAPAADVAATALLRCENCGNLVTQRYCGHCGQRLEPAVHSLLHFTKVATEDLTHADSRLWRTLGALLFKPGFLTTEFLAGRRARYLPPIRLYLVLSVAFFLFAAATSPKLAVLQIDEDGRTLHPVALDGSAGKGASAESVAQRQQRLCGEISYDGPWARALLPAMTRSCRKAVEDDGRELQVAFLHNIPRAMFVFLPLLAGVMMLMYWRPRHYYVEHLLLLVHNHACVFVVLMLAWGAARLLHPLAGAIQVAVFAYLAWYIFRSMRVAYRQGRLLTAAKFGVLVLSYMLFGVLMVGVTSLYSALML